MSKDTLVAGESPNAAGNQKFFLGGQDLEIETIRKLLVDNGIPFEDKQLVWGVKASAYLTEIEKVIAEGHTPVPNGTFGRGNFISLSFRA